MTGPGVLPPPLPIGGPIAAIPMMGVWLPETLEPHALAVCRHALSRVGVCEVPLGSNRGELVDQWNREAGAPPASFWCASFASAMWRYAGLPTPGKGKNPNCDELMKFMKETGRWSMRPALGGMVFYGPHAGDSTHVALSVRLAPASLVVGGNERIGAKASRNGVAVSLREEAREDILGYGHPWPLLPSERRS